jgi:hypothetical protein
MSHVATRGWEAVTQPVTRASSVESLYGDLARDTDGRLVPHYQYAAQQVGQLACGDLVVEPGLGAVAVDAISHREPFVYIRWTDGGPCTATVRYPAFERLPTRGPAQIDSLLIQRGVDQAVYKGQDIAADVARLIAAHLHFGPRSALYRFAIDGALYGRILAELRVAAYGRQQRRGWAVALAHYCQNRRSRGPVPGWAPVPVQPAVSPDSTKPARLHGVQHKIRGTPGGGVLSRKYIRSELALELLDAAFALGVAACRSVEVARATRFYPGCAPTPVGVQSSNRRALVEP